MAGLDGIGSGGRLDPSNQLSALGKSANVDTGTTPAGTNEHAGATTAATGVDTVQRSTAVQRILAEYDLHDITPREFSELTGRLYDSGAISDADRALFSVLRRELDDAGIDADESVDLFALVEDRLAQLRNAAEDNDFNGSATDSEIKQLAQQTALTLSQFDWLVKLDTVRQLGDSATVDERA
jgi:hypothetical protein